MRSNQVEQVRVAPAGDVVGERSIATDARLPLEVVRPDLLHKFYVGHEFDKPRVRLHSGLSVVEPSEPAS